MACKITVNQLRQWQAQPPERQVYVSDAQSPLQVRLNTDGTVAFCARRRRGKKREWKTFGRWPELGLAEARGMVRQWLSGVEVKSRSEEVAALTTLGDVLDAYFDEISLYARSWKARRSLAFREVPREWLQRPAASIGRAEVRALLLEVVRRSGYQANRLHKVLSAAYNRALDAELVERNPLAGLRRLFKERVRKNTLDFDQLRQLWVTCEADPSPLASVVQLLLLSGARLREVLDARWELITVDRWLKIPHNKSDRQHKVYLSDLAWGVVQKLPSRGVSPCLFPGRDLERPASSVAPLRRRLDAVIDLDGWHFHDLRSTFLTHLVGHCSVLPVVAKVCANHSLPGVTDANYIEREVYYPACKEAWIAYGKLMEDILAGRVGRVLPMRSAS